MNCASASVNRHLVVIGGAGYPPSAIERFGNWAGPKKDNHILIIDWADPYEADEDIPIEHLLLPYSNRVEKAPAAAELSTKKETLLSQLKRATGVFFTGGTQTRIMEVFEDAEIRQAAIDRFRSGAVFGGTSAGLAIMSATMLTGAGDFGVIDSKEVGVAPGLGLINNVILDQHFVRRKRLNRLISLMTSSRERYGIGVDEDTAVAIENGSSVEVMGSGTVVLFEQTPTARKLEISLFTDGDKFRIEGNLP